ncbi:MAG: nucleotidyltransferase domain-containing protein [Ferrimonas sp.]
MIDLREKDRVRIIALANQHLPHKTELWAYGSRVKGTNHDASDLDLVLVSGSRDDFSLSDMQAFKDALQDSTIPILIQVLSWWHIPESFQHNIKQCYEILCVVDKQAK